MSTTTIQQPLLPPLTEPLERGSKAWRNELLDMAQWAGAQDALRRLGQPSEWEQSMWLTARDGVGVAGHCGTAACLAGRFVLVNGWRPRRYNALEFSYTYVQHPLVDDGEERGVEDLAPELLSLDRFEADALFCGSNNLDDVLRVVNELLRGEPVTHVHADPETYCSAAEDDDDED